jgi:hypothetical protein
MPIPVVCSCSAKLKVGDHLSGKHIKCPKCGSVLPVGANGDAAAPPRPPAPPPPPAASAQQVLGASELSAAERERLQAELTSGEQLLWADKPAVRWAFLFAWGIGSGLIFTAIVLMVIFFLTWRQDLFHDTVGKLIHLAMLVGGIGLAIAGIVYPFYRRAIVSKSVYAATTKRALGWHPNWLGKLHFVVYQPADLAKLYRVTFGRGPGAVGHLIFGVQVTRKQTSDGIVKGYRRYGFAYVRDAQRVEKLLREHLVAPYLDGLYDE